MEGKDIKKLGCSPEQFAFLPIYCDIFPCHLRSILFKHRHDLVLKLKLHSLLLNYVFR